MIGIDLVDLHTAQLESNWRRKGYLDKVYTAEEQCRITTNPEPDKNVWLFWSMKEAAYKIWSRENNTRTYAPLSLACTLTHLTKNSATGLVICGKNQYITHSHLAAAYIYTLAAADRETISKIKIRIGPLQVKDNYRSANPDSVSHHGKYLALAWL